MKKLILFISLLLLFSCEKTTPSVTPTKVNDNDLIDIQPTSFAAGVARRCIGANYYDGRLKYGEIKTIKKLNFFRNPSSIFSSFEYIFGIEYFTDLEFLDVSNHNIRQLDLSYNKKLTTFECKGNPMSIVYVWKGFNVNSPPANFTKGVNYVVK